MIPTNNLIFNFQFSLNLEPVASLLVIAKQLSKKLIFKPNENLEIINWVTMGLSIIITHHKTPDLLKECIQSIKRYCEKLNYEIIVCDSEAPDDIEQRFNQLFEESKIIYIPFKKNVGYAKLVNAGINKSVGDFILIINADIMLSENSVSEMMEFLKNNDNVGLIGPMIKNKDGSLQQTYFRFYGPWTIICRRTIFSKTILCRTTLDHFLMRDKINPASEQVEHSGFPTDWLMGSAIMTTRRAINKIGLMDERFFMYFEDVDWAKRFWENGLKVIYFPSAQMTHLHQRYSKKYGGALDIFFNKYARIHIASSIKYFWKWRKFN